MCIAKLVKLVDEGVSTIPLQPREAITSSTELLLCITRILIRSQRSRGGPHHPTFPHQLIEAITTTAKSSTTDSQEAHVHHETSDLTQDPFRKDGVSSILHQLLEAITSFVGLKPPASPSPELHHLTCHSSTQEKASAPLHISSWRPSSAKNISNLKKPKP